MFFEGHIVEYLDSDQARLAYVRKQERDRLRVVDPKGRNVTIAAEHVLVSHRQAPETEFAAAAIQISERVQARRAEIDLELLWQSLGGAARELEPKELAEMFFSQATPDTVSAIFHALADENPYFKRRGGRFISKTPEQVSTEQLSKERQRAREESRNRLTAIVEELLRHDSEVPHASVVDRIAEWLWRRGESEVGTILERLAGSDKAREAAFEILVRAGRIPPETDRFLAIAGIDARFPQVCLEAADQAPPFTHSGERTDYRNQPAITIDDDDTAEVDDAITVEEHDGGIVVGIHIANPSVFVERGDPLDVEAARRASTIYLPSSTVRMLPERVSTDLASLVAGKDRPTFTFEARFDAAMNRVGFRAVLSSLRVHQRLSYDEADVRIAEGDRSFTILERLASRLRESRAAAGAITLRRPELKITVTGGDIRVKKIDPNSPSRLVVSEMMILANTLAADLAIGRGAPVIFRTQEPRESREPRETRETLPGALPENEALAFDKLRRTFKRSRLSLTPGLHSGLGLTAYTQISSPIRRFADLVTQRQLSALLRNQPLPYSQDDLLRVLAAAETAESEIRNLEDRADHYWLLEYLSREKMNQPLAATALDSGGGIELQEYYLRARVSGGPFRPGDTIQVMIESIHPAEKDVRFKLV